MRLRRLGQRRSPSDESTTIIKADGIFYAANGRESWLNKGEGTLVWCTDKQARQRLRFVRRHDAAVLLDQEMRAPATFSRQIVSGDTGLHPLHTFALGKEVRAMHVFLPEMSAQVLRASST